MRHGKQAYLVATEKGEVIEIVVAGSVDAGRTVINLGCQPPVVIHGKTSGVLLYEPFLLAHNKSLQTADGLSLIELPFGSSSMV